MNGIHVERHPSLVGEINDVYSRLGHLADAITAAVERGAPKDITDVYYCTKQVIAELADLAQQIESHLPRMDDKQCLLLPS